MDEDDLLKVNPRGNSSLKLEPLQLGPQLLAQVYVLKNRVQPSLLPLCYAFANIRDIILDLGTPLQFVAYLKLTQEFYVKASAEVIRDAQPRLFEIFTHRLHPFDPFFEFYLLKVLSVQHGSWFERFLLVGRVELINDAGEFRFKIIALVSHEVYRRALVRENVVG